MTLRTIMDLTGFVKQLSGRCEGCPQPTSLRPKGSGRWNTGDLHQVAFGQFLQSIIWQSGVTWGFRFSIAWDRFLIRKVSPEEGGSLTTQFQYLPPPPSLQTPPPPTHTLREVQRTTAGLPFGGSFPRYVFQRSSWSIVIGDGAFEYCWVLLLVYVTNCSF